jgi:hypothetical protein
VGDPGEGGVLGTEDFGEVSRDFEIDRRRGGPKLADEEDIGRKAKFCGWEEVGTRICDSFCESSFNCELVLLKNDRIFEGVLVIWGLPLVASDVVGETFCAGCEVGCCCFLDALGVGGGVGDVLTIRGFEVVGGVGDP